MWHWIHLGDLTPSCCTRCVAAVASFHFGIPVCDIKNNSGTPLLPIHLLLSEPAWGPAMEPSTLSLVARCTCSHSARVLGEPPALAGVASQHQVLRGPQGIHGAWLRSIRPQMGSRMGSHPSWPPDGMPSPWPSTCSV